MTSFKENILQLLQEMKGTGKFACTGSVNFILPGLEVKNAGNIAFPLNKDQAQTLIKVAHKAPFGLGGETVYDNTVRSAWEIDADQIKINNPQWIRLLNKVLTKVKEELGLGDAAVTASLYKLLVYEKGDFFLPHKDTEKEKGMFGTMVVELPSEHSGGALIVRYEGEEVIADFSAADHQFNINYTAFYADCEHEVKPLESGYRICLVYNLIKQQKNNGTAIITVSRQAEAIAQLLKEEINDYRKEPFIFLLGHQYTPENFAYDTLKLNDRFKADALLKAAELAGCYAKLCLVTSYKIGSPAYDGYYDDDNGVSDDAEMEEVYEERLEIGYWIKNGIPDLNVSFEENDLIATFAIEDDEPLIKEATGYMGNYGPDLEHWYHYGAVMIWTNDANAVLLKSTKKEQQLNWITYFNQNQNASVLEKQAVRESLVMDENELRRNEDVKGIDAVADWILLQNDFEALTVLNSENQQFYFEKITAEKWLDIFKKIGNKAAVQFVSVVVQHPGIKTLEKLIEVVQCMFVQNFDRAKAVRFAAELSAVTAKIYEENQDGKNFKRLSKEALKHLLTIEKYYVIDKKISGMIVHQSPRNYQNKVLAPFLLEAQSGSTFYNYLYDFMMDALQRRVDNKPQEPKDYSRFFPEGDFKSPDLCIIRDFMRSPTEAVFDYRRNQHDRSKMEDVIKQLKLDLGTQIIRRGSPHTLRLTKTTASYQNALSNWKEDVALLQQLKER